jgi:SPP1 gp7 family putative phage head morphogenesis protein
MAIDLKFVLGLLPSRAIEFFRRKGYRVTWDWEEQVGESHNLAFTVAKALTLDILQSIRDSVSTALAEGQTEEQFRRNLEPTLKQKGWWGRVQADQEQGEVPATLGTPWRLKNIYRTNMQTAYQAGRQQDFLENVEDRPYWQYVAVLDQQTRPGHRRLHGRVFRYDDPFWRYFRPPIDWGCRCSFRALSERDIQRRGLVVEGSEGLLSDTTKLLSLRSGIQVQVPTLRDPEGDISTGAPWGYDKSTAWQPDLSKFDPDLAEQYRRLRDEL